MPEHDHTASAAKPTALFPRPVSICRGTKIIGMFLPRWLFRARLTLSAVFFRHFSRPPAAPRLLPADFRSLPLPRLRATGPGASAAPRLLPADFRALPLPRLRATGPGASAAPACLCLPAAPCAAHFADICPCLHFCSALSFAARHFLHLHGSSFHGTSFPALFCGACSRLRFTDLFTLAISRLFRLPFLSAISHAFHLRLPRFSFCDSPRLSPALAPLFLLRFPRAFRPQFQRFSSTLFPPFPHEKNGAEAPFFCCLLTPWNR